MSKRKKQEEMNFPIPAVMDNSGERAIYTPLDDAKLNERAIEALRGFLDSAVSGQEVKPMVIGKIKGSFIIMPLQEKDGNYVIPEFKAPTRKEIRQKRRIVKKIMKKIEPCLKEEIGDITEIALMRKEQARLEKLYSELKNHKARLSNRVGCIFIDAGEESFQI